MLKFSIFFYMIYTISFSNQINDFHVESSGINPVQVDDIGIRFYLEVGNYGTKKVTVSKAYNPECCWRVEPDDLDCESMELYGGFTLDIDVGKKLNVTYTFPNIYPMDRIGVCKFFLKTLESDVVMHPINFNTSTGPEIGSFMQRLYDGGPLVYRKCNGVDENPRNSCQPFICHKKYGGFRNYYDSDIAKCVKVNRCKTELGADDLPTSAFDYDNNACKSLIDNQLSSEDKRTISEIIESSSLFQNMNPYIDVAHEDLILKCNHGVQKGTYCQCNDGWTSAMEKLADGKTKMTWCSKSFVPSSPLKFSLLVIAIFVAVILFLLLLYLWFWLFMCKTVQANFSLFSRYFPRTKLDFPFQYNPLWVIGDETFNTDKMLFDVIDEPKDIDISESEKGKSGVLFDKSL
ncbi:uncharacterized protein LOC100197717 isoform X4 [Hydra vulgaris]|uniref:Uncharacterized protein LOC100197717 isoform X4 n=2 Tax=Hydra vulgaris TaxID=6087 RepID=A0ABM4BJS5_HYDVU